VTEPLAELKTALEGTDTEAIKSAAEKVSTASSALGAAMYQEAAAAGEDGGAGAPDGDGSDAGSADDDDVVDAEIVDY
jgi:molecular chaperone DnaK